MSGKEQAMDYNFNYANFQEGDLSCIHIWFHSFKFPTEVETPSHHVNQQKFKKKKRMNRSEVAQVPSLPLWVSVLLSFYVESAIWKREHAVSLPDAGWRQEPKESRDEHKHHECAWRASCAGSQAVRPGILHVTWANCSPHSALKTCVPLWKFLNYF